MRPASIYSSMFVWNATTGGRFMASYLNVAHHLNNSSSVGKIIATQFFVTSILSGWGGQIADSMERSYPLKGRIMVLAAGLSLGTFAFLLEGEDFVIPRDNNLGLFMWHLNWRMVYSIAAALTGPVLDGLTLAHLKKEREAHNDERLHNNAQNDGYGRERLHGALWWGIGNVFIGYSIDHWGFEVLRSLTICSTVLCYVTIYLFYRFQSQLSEETTSIIGNAESHAHEQNGSYEIETDESTVESHERSPLRKGTKQSIESPPTENDINIEFLFSLLLSSPQNIGFLIAYCLLNVGFAVIENLIFLFYQSILGSSYTMCGLSVVFTIALEIPIFYISPKLLTTLGPRNMLIMACTACILRVIGYVLVSEMGPIIFALDLFHGITYACAQSASVAFVSGIMPDSYEASGQGLLQLMKGLSGTVGIVLGGFVQEYIGARELYTYVALLIFFGMMCMISVSVYVSIRSSRDVI